MSIQSQDRRAGNNTATNIKLDALHADITDIKLVLKELTVAINRLAIVEERQSQAADALERAFTALDKIEVRVSNLEMVSVNSKQTNDWVGKVVWAGLAVLAIIVFRKIGLPV